MEKKLFYFKIVVADLLDFATDPEGQKMTVLQFAKELHKGESNIPYIKRIIEEANNYKQLKSEAGRKGGLAKASSAIAEPSSAIAKASQKQKQKQKQKEPITSCHLVDDVDQQKFDSVPYVDLVAAYHKLCPSLPKIIKVTDGRRRALKSAWKNYADHDGGFPRVWDAVLKKAEASDFVAGRTERWAGANFDWLLKEANMVKVIEGNYDNRAEVEPVQKKTKMQKNLEDLFRETSHDSPFMDKNTDIGTSRTVDITPARLLPNGQS